MAVVSPGQSWWYHQQRWPTDVNFFSSLTIWMRSVLAVSNGEATCPFVAIVPVAGAPFGCAMEGS